MEQAPPGAVRKTPLNSLHREAGAKMVLFGGWDMPVEYAGLISEHLAVRQAAGLFDVSHMGELEVTGEGALAFLQRTTSNDVTRLADGQCQYTALVMPNGAAVDDFVLYRFSAQRFLLVVNAGNTEKDFAWLRAQGPEGCELRNRSEEFALLALQGPEAQAILQGLTAIPLADVKFYHFAEGQVAGVPAIVSRTGYTGEDGFEIAIAPGSAAPVWTALLERGRDKGLVPVGLGARDTLRLEARMCLYGSDLDETTTLVEAGLGWIVNLDAAKGEFPGKAVLAAQKAGGPPRKLVGFEVLGRGIARHGHPVLIDGRVVGAVTSGTYAPFVKKNIGLCYLPAASAAVGTDFTVDIRGQRVPARVVPTPFYKRAK